MASRYDSILLAENGDRLIQENGSFILLDVLYRVGVSILRMINAGPLAMDQKITPPLAMKDETVL